jgi:hypothetical protein
MSFLGQSWEFMAELAKRTPWSRINIQLLIDDIAHVAPEFVRFLENSGRVMVVQGEVFPTWRTITLGLHKSPERYIVALEAKGMKISTVARDILVNITCSEELVDLELVDVTGVDLGFTKGVYTTQECYDRAVIFGLYPCPAETGPALRVQYNEQPAGNRLLIAMQAILDRSGFCTIFKVLHDGSDLVLYTDTGRSSYQWLPKNRWIFCRRKP